MFAEVHFRLPIDQSFTYEVPESDGVFVGSRVKAQFAGRKPMVGIITGLSETPPEFETKPVDKVMDGFPLLPPDLMELGQWMSEYYMCSLGEALGVMLPKGQRLTKELKEMAAAIPGEDFSYPDLPPLPARELKLNPEQKAAFNNIITSPAKQSSHLLYGVTGSGKTEVYIEAILDGLRHKRSAIMLVPEITLTVQLVDRLQKVFGDRLAVLHSYLPTSQKFKNWMQVRLGLKDVVLGTRSAIFAPVRDLGLVIIDEEHDSSYKEHSAPRYHSRQIALQRIKRWDGKCILGSATPALESFYWATEQGRFGYHRLQKRARGAELPKVHVIHRGGDRHFLSPPLMEETRKRIGRGEQAIYLLNRRGYSPQAYCSRCKDIKQCNHCSVTLTYHRSDYLLCHLCGYAEAYTGRCPECSNKLELVGVGTQQAEEMIYSQLSDIRVRRLDQDSVTKATVSETVSETLAALGRHEFDILLGTQMIAKGLDFSNVTLVAVLNADIGLGLPDFRANERIFSLLVQVAGRAGRAEKEGLVIFQSMTPDLPLLTQAQNLDYDSFYKSEIEIRRSTAYPPFSRIIRVVFRSPQESKLLEFIENFNLALGEINNGIAFQMLNTGVSFENFNQFTRIQGPLPAPLYLSSDQYRYHLIVRTIYPVAMKKVLSALRGHKALKNSKIHWQIDIDPMDMM